MNLISRFSLPDEYILRTLFSDPLPSLLARTITHFDSMSFGAVRVCSTFARISSPSVEYRNSRVVINSIENVITSIFRICRLLFYLFFLKGSSEAPWSDKTAGKRTSDAVQLVNIVIARRKPRLRRAVMLEKLRTAKPRPTDKALKIIAFPAV